MKYSGILLIAALSVFLSSCNKGKIKTLEQDVSFKNEQIKDLEEEVAYLKETNSNQMDLMEDLSIVSKTGAESIKQSLENMTEQYGHIKDLTSRIQSKDSLNLALVTNLKRSLTDINDEDVQVEVRGGKVHVSISDKMLFRSGSANLNSKAQSVLDKIASVINDHNDLDVMVEGHTDDVPMNTSCIEDNWDLSAKRATAVVRVLQEDYYVDPQRLIAAGRSEYVPREDNSTSEGRSINRRTEIVIMPQLDQFFKLLESPGLRD
jgi:chemotaxis protein MotB